MAEEKKICEWKHDGVQCDREVWDKDGKDGEYCICHSKKADKDPELFQEATWRVVAQSGTKEFDFTGFVFPAGFRFRGSEMQCPSYFTGATFLGDIEWTEMKWNRPVDFTGAVFHGKVRMKGGFRQKVSLDRAHFMGEANFSGCLFDDKFSAQHAVFSAQSDWGETHFLGEADWENATFEGVARFMNGSFGGFTDFRKSEFRQYATFGHRRFEGSVSFMEATSLKHLSFDIAEFKGGVNFEDMVSQEETSFGFVAFNGAARFNRTQFHGMVDFRHVRWSGEVDFKSTVFGGPATFRGMKCLDGSSLLFDGDGSASIFTHETDFTRVWIEKKGALCFRKTGLYLCRFLETDVSLVEFVDVKWPRKGGLVSNYYVQDERDGSSANENGLLAQLYRRLQANYTASYDYATAGEFYVREQNAILRSYCVSHNYDVLLPLLTYKLASLYGQSVKLPLLWLIGVLLAFPAFFLYGGIILGSNSVATNYAWSWNPLEFLLLKADFWEACAHNLGFVTLNRAGIQVHLTDLVQQNVLVLLETIIVATLLTLFILAVRRRFKRKSF